MGGFDKNIADYGNEVELCKRIVDNGYRTVWIRNSYIHHLGRQSYGDTLGDEGILARYLTAERYIKRKAARQAPRTEPNRVKVSAVIPTFNRRSFITRAVDSVLAQTMQVDEIIVVDDGSTDGTAQLLRTRYGSRVTVIVQENQGVSAARRRGVEEAQGEWVAFLDSDDEWLPERNAAFLRAASALSESVAWIFGDSRIVTDRGDDLTLFGESGIVTDDNPTILDDSLSVVYPRMLCMLQSSFIRRDALIDLRCFNEGLRNSEDLLAGIQIASVRSFAAIPLVVTKWYRTSDLLQSSLMGRGPFTEDHYRARILGYALATQFAGSTPWAVRYEEAVRQLCKTRAQNGLTIRRLAFDQFRFGTTVASVSFCCAAMLGSSFIRSGGVMKGKFRTLFGGNAPERQVSKGPKTGTGRPPSNSEFGQSGGAVGSPPTEPSQGKIAISRAEED